MSEQAVFAALKYRIEVDESGTRWYRNNAGRLHRTDGPAVEWANGDKFWYQNGSRHRTDGPAVELHSGHKEWYQNGSRHRTDGPAIVFVGGGTQCFINDDELTEYEFNQRVKDYERTSSI